MDELIDQFTVPKKTFLLPRSFSCTQTSHRRHLPRRKIPTVSLSDDPLVILYTTSLRGIRQTHADCCAVRAILRGLRIAFDERDVSMDASYRRELQLLIGRLRPVSLPQLFVRGRRISGAEEVRQLHEIGELGRLLDGLPRQDPSFICGGCGGARFVPCGRCSGSQKVFVEEEGWMRWCENCNENGLVRCPNCSFSSSYGKTRFEFI